VADGSALRLVDDEGNVTTLVEDLGTGLYGVAPSSNGVVVAIYDERRVIEINRAGKQRVLVTSEPPWAPTDVAVRGHEVFVVEVAQHPCCWKGPRVRRVTNGQKPVTLLTIDDGNHLHLTPRDRPLEWLVGTIVLCVISIAIVWRMRRRTRRRVSQGNL
jgi:hypothetical protein